MRTIEKVRRVFHDTNGMMTNLPVQAPTQHELLISLKTVKALGLRVAMTLLARVRENRIERLCCCACSQPLLAPSTNSRTCSNSAGFQRRSRHAGGLDGFTLKIACRTG